ncbi:putative alpha/beta hydrolase family esterase [Agromyces cerinus]|uniref:RBBP9/YdeN family alpha/beta hydrolase n=1 Tax=Agromyces cerinus TaxID=33878 RepID=UPI00195ED4CC|nr:alpha/beta hydrolase [Agromyces cerinus]MBM7831487.1 putative alpha/beta hydrolase family esterase [Agromyces cerinus]
MVRTAGGSTPAEPEGRELTEYLILHGYENRRPDGHWERWLAAELEGSGASVRYPQLPDPDDPVLDDWIAAIEAQLVGTEPASLTVVCHSLACAAWLVFAARRAAAGRTDAAAHRVLLVAPVSDPVLRGIPQIAGFALGGDPVHAAAEHVIVVAGDTDPYCPEGAEPAFVEPLGAEHVIVQGGGHLTIEDGFGPFPLVLELATR